jgi:hypothetical protein
VRLPAAGILDFLVLTDWWDRCLYETSVATCLDDLTGYLVLP